MNRQKTTIFTHKKILIPHRGGAILSHKTINIEKQNVIDTEYLQKFKEDGQNILRIKANKIGGYSNVPYQRSNLSLAPPSPIAQQGYRKNEILGGGLVSQFSKLPISLKSKTNRNNIKLIL